MTIVTYHHRAKRARRKNPDRPFPLGRIVIARPPRKKHYGEIREAVPDNAERTRLPPWRSISHEFKVPKVVLHNSEDEGRADAEQQHTIGGL